MPNPKKTGAALPETVESLIVIFFGLILVITIVLPKFYDTAEASVKDSLCTANIGIRKFEIQGKVGGAKVLALQAPLVGCVTIDKKEIPQKDKSQAVLERNIADLMRDCWQRYDEGRAGDIFKEGNPWKNSCQTCYLFKVKSDIDIKNKKISAAEFKQYLENTPYKPQDITNKCFSLGDTSGRGGFCADQKEACIGKGIKGDVAQIEFDANNDVCEKAQKGNGCCYSPIKCINNGGKCSKDQVSDDFTIYPAWSCPSGQTCYIRKEQNLNYFTYFQRGGGKGMPAILTDIEPGQVYAVSFGAPTDKCDHVLCKVLGAGGGFLVASIPTAIITGKITLGVCAIPVLGQAVCIPTAGVAGIVTIGAGLIGGTLGSQASDKITVSFSDFFNQRPVSTIYLTRLEQIQGQSINNQQGEALCSIIPE